MRLSFDEHEEVAPSRQAASMLVFDKVTDALEACGEYDTSWLDSALTVLDGADG